MAGQPSFAGITVRSTSTALPASTSAINTTGRRTAWTSLSLTGSRNDPNLTPVWFAMNSTHTWSLTVSIAAPSQEHSEPVQHDLIAPDRALGPPGVAQHRHDMPQLRT